MAFCDFAIHYELMTRVTPMESEIIEKYGNRLRVRVCGLCWNGDNLLVANHKLYANGDFWAPIGGGIEFGETAIEALKREFEEEANIQIKPNRFLFGCEFIQQPLHAIELFFEVTLLSGTISTGNDPESTANQQILQEVKYLQYDELMAIEPDKRHGIFKLAQSSDELKKLTGFYRI